MADNVKVAISTDFLTAFAKLPRQVQGKVTEFVNKFRNDPTSPGINYEKIANAQDKKIYSVRIDNTYRGIVVRQPETGVYLLLWVDHHDEAYEWASRKRCEVNPKTGAVQVFDVQTIQEEVVNLKEEPLFADIADDQLLEIGVPEAQLEYVKAFTKKEDFYNSANSIPHDVYEYLSWLVEGFTIEDVKELIEDEKEEQQNAEDLSAALEVPASLKSFVIVDGED